MIGTTAAVLGAAAIGGVASLASGALSSAAAQKASQSEAGAAVYAADLANEQYKTNRADMQPFLDSGKKALDAYMGEMGLSDAAKNGTFKSGFQKTPGYDFAVSEGEKGTKNNFAALGLSGSGAALKALTKFRMGLADQTYNNYLDRLSASSVGGQAQTNTAAAMGTQNAINVGQAGQDAASARGSGYVGSANAFSNALGNISNNAGSALGWLSGNRGWASA